jgi:hypothetical protein
MDIPRFSSSSSEINNDKIEDCKKLGEIITHNNFELVKMIQELRAMFPPSFAKISLVEFVRWCRTASVLNPECRILVSYAAAIYSTKDSCAANHNPFYERSWRRN